MLETKKDLQLMENMSPEERETYHMYRLEIAEGMMCLLFAAARDKISILELLKTYRDFPDEEELENKRGFSR